MASDADDDKPSAGPAGRPDDAARHIYGPRRLAAVLPALVRPAFRGRAAATAQVLTDWAEIVGPAFAPLTTPLRLSAGTLTIACSGPMAMELQHVGPALIDRVNSHLGRIAVIRLRFLQTVPVRPTPPLPRATPPLATEAAQAAVAHLPAGEVRDALERLGRLVLARAEG
jgi:hypothetical protein